MPVCTLLAERPSASNNCPPLVALSGRRLRFAGLGADAAEERLFGTPDAARRTDDEVGCFGPRGNGHGSWKRTPSRSQNWSQRWSHAHSNWGNLNDEKSGVFGRDWTENEVNIRKGTKNWRTNDLLQQRLSLAAFRAATLSLGTKAERIT